MTRLVGIDTTSWWGGLALVESGAEPGDTRCVAEVGLHVRRSHTAHLLPLLEALLEHAGWSKSGIDGFAASRGPGSFTGARVGLGTVRGLALAADRPALGVVSLAAMAEAHGPAETERVPMLDAGRGEVYFARYDAASSPPLERESPGVGPAVRACCEPPPVFFGPGAVAHADDLRGRGRLAAAPTTVAAAVGRLALLRLRDGAGDGDGLVPLYVRPPDAKLKSKKRN